MLRCKVTAPLLLHSPFTISPRQSAPFSSAQNAPVTQHDVSRWLRYLAHSSHVKRAAAVPNPSHVDHSAVDGDHMQPAFGRHYSRGASHFSFYFSPRLQLPEYLAPSEVLS